METFNNIDLVNLAGVHLNLSEIYSSTGQHTKALKSAQQALFIAKTSENMDRELLLATAVAHQTIGK